MFSFKQEQSQHCTNYHSIGIIGILNQVVVGLYRSTVINVKDGEHTAGGELVEVKQIPDEIE